MSFREVNKMFHTFFKYIFRTVFQEEEAAKRKEAIAANRLEKAKRRKEIEDEEDDKHDGGEAVPPPKKKYAYVIHMGTQNMRLKLSMNQELQKPIMVSSILFGQLGKTGQCDMTVMTLYQMLI